MNTLFALESMTNQISKCSMLKYSIVVMLTSMISMIVVFSFPVINMVVVCSNNFSAVMLLLSLLVWTFIINSYPKMLHHPNMMYMSVITLMLLATSMFFTVSSLLVLYVLFETSLVMILMLIIGWGYQVERVQAGVYLLFYTVTASLPLMLVFIYLGQHSMKLFMQVGMQNMSWIMMLVLMLAFLIKFPVYFLHLWLPKAHVEAPTPGSIILAGILLKMGSYGVYRMLQLWTNALVMAVSISVFMMCGMVISVIVCICQSDMKSLIAYSSVNHMTMMWWSMCTMFSMGIKGSLLLMLSHGLVSSLLFWLVGTIYNMFKHRIIFFIQGLLITMPILGGVTFAVLCMNFSVPPMLSVFSELMVMSSTIHWSLMSSLILMVVIFLSCYYCLMLYSYVSHGKYNSMSHMAVMEESSVNNMMVFMLMVVMMIFQLPNML